MKIKHSHTWKKQTPVQQQQAMYRRIAPVLWALFLVTGVGSVLSFGVFGGKSVAGWEQFQTTSFFATADKRLSAQIFSRAATKAVTSCVVAAGGNRIGNVYLTEERLMECASPLDTDALLETANVLNQFYQGYQISTCVIAVPPAIAFYGEELLEGISCPTQLEEIDSFYQQMDSSIRKIDTYHVLLTASEDYIYNRTDPRWSCYGAYCVYRSAIQKMGFAAISYDQYSVTHTSAYRGSLYQQCLYSKVTPDMLDIYACENGSTVTDMTAYLADGTTEARQMYEIPEEDAEDPYDFYVGADCEKLVIQTDLDNQKKLLLLKDSYADCMIPFLLQHYSEVCVIDVTEASHTLDELVDVTAYTQVLVLCDGDTFAKPRLFQSLFHIWK